MRAGSVIVALLVVSVSAEDALTAPPRTSSPSSFQLSSAGQAPDDDDDDDDVDDNDDDDDDEGDDDDGADIMTESNEYGYKGVDDFFNIREAHPNVDAGEIEFEIPFMWQTRSDGSDDDFLLGPRPSMKFGITDDLFIEAGVYPVNFGDGDHQGNGDASFKVFYRFLDETDDLPAVAVWGETRLPTGPGSSGVDADVNAAITKTLAPRFRVHLAGFVRTANGGRGMYDRTEYLADRDDEPADRRHFQWGVGPGFDYQLDDQTVLVLNYLHRSSEYYGNRNTNLLETGVVREICAGQNFSLGVDVGLDGAGETPDFAAKLQYAIALK